MQSELNHSTFLIYKHFIVLASAGYKPKLDSIAVSHSLEPCLFIGYPDVLTGYHLNFSFDLYDDILINPKTGQREDLPTVFIEIKLYDLDIDWQHLNDTFGYEIMNVEDWDRNVVKELKK